MAGKSYECIHEMPVGTNVNTHIRTHAQAHTEGRNIVWSVEMFTHSHTHTYASAQIVEITFAYSVFLEGFKDWFPQQPVAVYYGSRAS